MQPTQPVAQPAAQPAYAAAPSAQTAPSAQPAAASSAATQTTTTYTSSGRVGAHAAPTAPAQTDARTAQRAAKQTAKANKQGGGFKTFALGFLGAACAFALGAGLLGANGLLNKPTIVENISDGGTVVLGADTNTTVDAEDNHTESLAEAVAGKVLPSIVGIDVYATGSAGYSFWGAGSTDSETLAGLGSGVVISEDGYILTNYHVVEGASKLMVTVGGEEREAPAHPPVVARDEDVVVLRGRREDDKRRVADGELLVQLHLRP